jgi:hypothetical protein
MWQARKARDLQRDPRFALHSATVDGPDWPGDVKISGRVEEIVDPTIVEEIIRPGVEAPPGPAHLFRADIAEVAVTRLGEPADHLRIDLWREGEPAVRRFERK